MPHFIFIQQISILNILNMLYNLHFFFSSKCRLFHNATLFGFCITHILNTGCAKIYKKKSVAKRLMCFEVYFFSVFLRLKSNRFCELSSKCRPKWYAYCFLPFHCVFVSFTGRPVLSHGWSLKSHTSRSKPRFECWFNYSAFTYTKKRC
jgi:hypothetical protein